MTIRLQDRGAVDLHAGAAGLRADDIGSGAEDAGAKPRWDAPTITTFKINETLGVFGLSIDGASNLSAG